MPREENIQSPKKKVTFLEPRNKKKQTTLPPLAFTDLKLSYVLVPVCKLPDIFQIDSESRGRTKTLNPQRKRRPMSLDSSLSYYQQYLQRLK